MTTAHPPHDLATGTPPAPAAAGSKKMRKVAFASFIGTVIEFYDFSIYGTAAALVFASAFFPALGTQAGTVVAFATLGVAFVARPLGSILFGHYGDRLGRKRTLIITMSMMGVATILIGLLPTAGTIGIAAPIILVLLRVAQGLAAGGEWAGAALFTSEHSPKDRRGFWAMWTNLGGAIANVVALFVFLMAALFMSDTTFAAWGWRIPFLFSIVILGVGLYIRLRIEETPAFEIEQKKQEQEGPRALPFKEAIVEGWKQILLGAGALVMAFSLGYIGIAYLVNYGTATLHLSRPSVLLAAIIGNLVNALFCGIGGTLSDRFGRRKVLVVANTLGIPWALLLFPILDLGGIGAFYLGMLVTFVLAGTGFGVAGSFLSELFPTRYRYTAAGLSYSLGGVLGGAIPPLVAASIIGSYGGFFFGVLLAGYCLVGLLCTLALKETKDRDMIEATKPAAALGEATA